MIDQALLRQYLAEYQIAAPENLGSQLDRYAELLVDWNGRMNLTGITQPDEILVKHFVDSLLLFRAAELPKNAHIIDVGTGAGFPGVVAKLCRTDLQLTLLDSLQKRILFLQELTAALGIESTCMHGRAEEFGGKPGYRERFDCATARAVAHLRELSEYCLPFVRLNGCFVALKGYEIETELDEARYAIGQLGGKVEAVEKFTLPDQSKRALVRIRKVRQTPPKYPRISAKIKKYPLNG